MAGLARPAVVNLVGTNTKHLPKSHPKFFGSALSSLVTIPKTALINRALCTDVIVVAHANLSLSKLPASPSQDQIQDAGDSIPCSRITWGQLAVQGPRTEMEDEIVVEGPCPYGFTYAAVFDGHAGFSSVKFLRNELYKECMAALQGGLLLESNDVGVIKDALSAAFLQTDRRLLSWLDELREDNESGSTATVMFLRADRLIVAHVGDSRLVLSCAGKAEELSADHRPFGNSKTSLAEIKRVKDAGGWVRDGRVCGSLSVSRAFGDILLKTRRKEMLDNGVKNRFWTNHFVSRLDTAADWIVALPDVNVANINQDTEFILLASDGLWDTIKSAEAVKFVTNQLKQHGDVQLACEALAGAALDRNGQDNISIIIADLGKIQCQEGFAKRQELKESIKQVDCILNVKSLNVLWQSISCALGEDFPISM
ncbi:hypothetical protein O6H91_22G019600 [Diphasiastrum complanatum]|uniref:Uncharacterized protein n=1 Tax=Diphasiastrum complanatum TaxID=34168 RepID=A0ACC2ADF0_DIPCM|nr:hypothetical protein O6H91_22G019600 [Diphasiastrum complanatum]